MVKLAIKKAKEKVMKRGIGETREGRLQGREKRRKDTRPVKEQEKKDIEVNLGKDSMLRKGGKGRKAAGERRKKEEEEEK